MKKVLYRYLKGQVWFVDLTHLQLECGVVGKIRPCLIISSNRNNAFSQNVIVAPIVTRDEDSYDNITGVYEYEYGGKTRGIYCNQITVVGSKRLKEYMYTMSQEAMKDISKEIMKALDLGNYSDFIPGIDVSIPNRAITSQDQPTRTTISFSKS